MANAPIIPCRLLESTKQEIEQYAEDLKSIAPEVGQHGLDEQAFWESGLFRSAIERLRGQQAASTQEKHDFINSVLSLLKNQSKIADWHFTGSGERHDYEVTLNSGRFCAIEAKGCLDGNNTNIFERPPNADEFIIWSLCQNPGSDPAKNAWSGLHTRLSAEIIHQRQKVDALIIWDMVCGTIGRPCPKLESDPSRATKLDNRVVPPPCIYLLPRTVPDPRNNPKPPIHRIAELEFIDVLYQAFACVESDVVGVEIETRNVDADIERKTRYYREGSMFRESNWTTIRRSR